MAAFRFSERRTRRWWFIGVSLAVFVAAAATLIGGSGASTAATACNSLSGSNFEIDPATGAGTKQNPFAGGANLVVNGGAPCIDWQSTATGNPASVFNSVAKSDKPSGTSDDSFGKGTSENDTDPAIVSGSIPPNKSDLQAFGVYKESTAGGKFLNLFWSRVNSPSGTTVMDFELNKLACSGVDTDPNCVVNSKSDPDPAHPGHVLAEVPVRSVGDELISYVFSGSSTPTVCLYTWGGSSWTQPGVQIDSNPLGSVCGTGATQESGDALGSINFGQLSAANTYGLGDITPLSFGEVSVNFNAIFPPGGTCGSFGSVHLSSRSSATFTDELKDFIAPENVLITNCTQLSTSVSSKTPASPGTLGDAISDTATLSNASSPSVGIVFKAYGPFDLNGSAANDTCVDSGANANLRYTSPSIALTGPNASGDYTASVPTTAPNSFVPTAAGRYQWIASFAGDSNNGSSSTKCLDAGEASAVQAAPGLNTTLSCASACATVTVGSTVHDSASLTSTSGFRPTGTATYTVYTDNKCTVPATVDVGQTIGQISAQPTQVTLTASGTPLIPNSADVTFHAATSYWWQATYSGDGNNQSAKSDCTTEPMTVIKLPSTIATAQSFIPNDTATITGSGTFDGTVSFALYATANCTGSTVYTENNVALSGTASGSTAKTSNTTTTVITATGTYSWKVTYSGDSTHKDVITSCTTGNVETSNLTINNGTSTTSS
jgi:hypothetical protein